MQENLQNILTRNLSPYFLKIYQDFVDENIVEFNAQELSIEEYILAKIKYLILSYQNLNASFQAKIAPYNNSNELDKKNIILALSALLGSNEEDIYEDEDALNRWLDSSAMQDRLEEQNADLMNQICFLVKQSQYIILSASSAYLQLLMELIDREEFKLATLETLIIFIKNKALQPEQKFLNAIPAVVSNLTNIWIIARYVEILAICDSKEFIRYYRHLFENSYDHLPKTELMFLKSEIVGLLQYLPAPYELITLAIGDSSPYVRQAAIAASTKEMLVDLTNIIFTDPDIAVRAYALIIYTDLLIKTQDISEFLTIAAKIVALEVADPFVVKTLINSCKKITYNFNDLDKKSYITLTSYLQKIIQSSISLDIRRLACDAYLEISLALDKRLVNSKIKLENIIKNLPLGQPVLISDFEINNLLLEEMGKILYLIASKDFDIEFWQDQGNYFVQRGSRKKLKLWRFLYEFFHPSTEKRASHSHIKANMYHGKHLVISNLAELSNTGVPGEALYIPSEGTRRFLPPLDYILSIIYNKQDKYIFTSEGVTIITPPANIINKLYAYIKITLDFKSIAALRNVCNQQASLFVDNLRDIGIEVNFKEDSIIKSTKETKQFFTKLSMLPLFSNFNIFDYFASPNENNLLSLSIFLALIILILSFRRIRKYKYFRKLRNELPLVVGGWGTRGKTGTERLKTALFVGLGLKTISKTTGSKASMIISNAKKELYELPLIRPYNLHTILEQRSITMFAAKYKAKVFLWECMGLNPDYVKLMQNDWMQDDISTITNTYPDHEEVQGPSGQDVAESISRFIRKNGYIITTEEQMLPILQEQARLEQAIIHNISPNEGQLLTTDILTSFPYNEHPNNIILIMHLAKILGIPQNIALKSIIDNVMPDIGSLKCFIPCKINNKELQFVNGMSANEVVGALDNWRRIALDKITIASEPDLYLTVLINNRDDRQKRSKEFAAILVSEFSVDKFYLIGTNLKGLKKYLLKKWMVYLNNIIDKMKSGDALHIFEQTVKHLRICINELEKNKSINAIKLAGDDKAIKTGISIKQSIEKAYENYNKIKSDLQANIFPEQEIQRFLTNIFLDKLILIDGHNNNPNNIITQILNSMPPGFKNKIVGVQNIKSPGIEFINAWYEYEKCHIICENLKNNYKIEEGLKTLAQSNHSNILCTDYIKQTLAAIKYTKHFKEYLALIQQIENNLLAQEEYTAGDNNNKSNFFNELFGKLIELQQNYKNTRLAKMIYKDLENKRISLKRASIELNKIL